MERIRNSLYKLQPYLLGLGIFVSLTAVSFEFHGTEMDLLWKDHPILPAAILLAGLSFGLLYLYSNSNRSAALAGGLTRSEEDMRLSLLKELTPRQEAICRLIIGGRSNKEITAALFIETSTLKTHINQIYKKLNVKSRKELRSIYGDKLISTLFQPSKT